jgi:hypothetical protein
MTVPVWLLLADLATALVIETGSPDALCPDLSQTREAVVARLGTLKVSKGGWRARYTIGHAPESAEGDFVRLELWDPNGELRLQRDLPLEAGACATMSHAIALILERYFRSLVAGPPSAEAALPHPGAQHSEDGATAPTDGEPGAAAAAQAPTSASPTTSASTAAPSRPTAQDRPSTPAPSARQPQPQRVVALSAGLGYAGPPSTAATQLSAAADLSDALRLGLTGLIEFSPESEPVGSGAVHVRRYPLRLWLGWLWRSGQLSGTLGPELLLSVEVGRGDGIDDQDTGVRVAGGVGLGGGVALALSERLGLCLSGGLDVTPPALAGEFVLDPDSEPVLASPWAAGFAAAGVLFTIPQ